MRNCCKLDLTYLVFRIITMLQEPAPVPADPVGQRDALRLGQFRVQPSAVIGGHAHRIAGQSSDVLAVREDAVLQWSTWLDGGMTWRVGSDR